MSFNDKDDDDEFITESELGTKQYWNNFYDEELKNFHEFGDAGETWFGMKITKQIINWINENNDKNDSICDIGCGNGFILAQLASKHDFTNLYGYDYSEKAIEFCREQHKNLASKIHFNLIDILNNSDNIEEKFSTIIDKGTYDAICLMPDTNIDDNRRKYLKFLERNLKDNGHFLLITCNFTKNEILKFLCDTKLELMNEFETPTLKFGGNVGKQITGLIFKMTK